MFRRLRRGDTLLTDHGSQTKSVALIVKRRARTAGVAAAELSGQLTTRRVLDPPRASRSARSPTSPGHKKPLPVLRRYIRTATAFDDVGDVL